MTSNPIATDVTHSPLRALCVLANPSDLPRFDDSRYWQEIQDALSPFVSRGSVAVERLREPTESALRKRLSEQAWQVLHLVSHAQERSAVRYATIALQSSDGRARNLTAGYLANLVHESPSLRVLILQGCDSATSCFDVLAETLVQSTALVVVTAPFLYGRQEEIFLSKLYAGILMGLHPSEIENEIATGLGGLGSTAPVRILTSPSSRMPESVPASVGPIGGPSRPGRKEAQLIEEPNRVADWHEILARKRAAGVFDVFLCHNSADKPAVKRIAQQLKESGILPWLDVWELPPGQPWQPALEKQIANIRAAAVCFGAAGIGPWQQQEMYGFIDEFVSRKVPVIPLLLPDAPLKPELPIFLRGMTWVDFRLDDPDPMKELIWGITGERPED